MRILVTGGAGFIGSNFIRHILKRCPSYKIINLDKLTYAGNLENLKNVRSHPNYNFVQGDICNPAVVRKLMSGCDCVVNFAAESHVDRSILEPDAFIKTNFLGTHILLEAARENGIKRFLQIGTDEVYGSIENGSFKETAPLLPSSPYSSSKASADLLALSYHTTYGMNVIVTRSTNNFGPYQYPEKFIPLFVINAIEGKELPLYGDGLNVRSWIHVEDNCRGIFLLMKTGKPGEIYNIGSSTEMANIKVARLILKFLRKDESLIRFVKDRPGHDRRYSVNSEKIRLLGWKELSDFKKMLEKTVKWYNENHSWWMKIRKKKDTYQNYYKRQYGGKI
ncbi:MAG: dTDP-glucose 4,6-dehydratase [Candidatus Omnitrophica bacterium]|nr:dTDP-glucose 4,6-dehydratase [Candidatus Omnitrophota bacterium]